MKQATATTPSTNDKVADNQIGVNFVDQSGKTVKFFAFTKGSTDATPWATLSTIAGQDPTDATKAALAYQRLTQTAGITAYGYAGLTADQIAANNTAIKGAKYEYGSTITLTVNKQDTNKFFNSFNVYDEGESGTNKSPLSYFENADGVGASASYWSDQVTNNPALTGAIGKVINVSDLEAALNDNKMGVIYYAYLTGVNDSATNRLTATDLNGNGNKEGGVLNSDLLGKKVTVLRMTQPNVKDYTRYNDWQGAEIFGSPNMSTIRQGGISAAIMYNNQGNDTGNGAHTYTITAGSAAYQAKSLKAMYTLTQG
ncbi:hypothetical protein FIU75_04155 [Lactobacillus buchneri]|nr:hypothetical protein [Lentilactobacillus buchneri]